MDKNEMTGSNPFSSADSATEGKFSFRDLMKAAEAKHPANAPKENPESPGVASETVDGPGNDQTVYELTEIVEESPGRSITVSEFNTEIMKKVSEVAEKVAREMFPDIAEKIIREEIAKLKTTEE